METNISDGAIEFSVKNCIAGESYRFGAKKSPAPASNPEVSGSLMKKIDKKGLLSKCEDYM